MRGDLFINEVDVYEQYGLFLARKKAGSLDNFSALLKPSKLKAQVAVSIREENGEKLPEVLNQQFEARDISLYCGIAAINRSQFLLRKSQLVSFLRTGDNGWLNIRVPEIDKTFRVYVKDFPAWEQSIFQEVYSFGYVTILFREPNPTF
jgi:hypothetical protein